MDRHLWSLACLGKTLKAEHISLSSHINLLYMSTLSSTFFKTWLLNIYSLHIMNTERLYKCQEGAGELSGGKDTKFYSPEMSLIPCEIAKFWWKNILRRCQYSFSQEVFQPVHMLVTIQLKNWMAGFSTNWVESNHSINLSQFYFHAVWSIRKHWDQLMKIEFTERIKQERI